MPPTATATSFRRTTGSLTQPSARTGHACESCGSDRLTELEMTLTDGSHVAFTSCHRCERRSWRQNGLELPIQRVLAKTRKLR